MKEARKVVKNTWILYARMAITILISLFATRLTLSALGTEDFGIFNLVGGVIAMLTFLNAAMTAASQRFMSFAQGASNDYKQLEIFNVSSVLHLCIAFFLLIFLEIFGYYLFDNVLEIPIERLSSAKLIFQFMIISTIFTILSVPYDAVINAHENMLLFAVLGVIESSIKLGIAFFIVNTAFDKLSIYGFLTASLSIFLLVIRILYCRTYYKECKLNPKKYFNKITFKEMSSFAGWSFLGSSTNMLTNYGQGIVLNMFFGPIANASQGIANQVSGQLGAFSLNMLKALNPLIAKSEGAGNRKLMINASMIGCKSSFFLLLFFINPVIWEMPYIFSFWLKDIPPYAIIFCRLLLIRNLIEQLYTPLTTAISAVGNIKKYQFYTSILNFFPLVISYILFTLKFNPESQYIVFIVYSILTLIVTVFFCKANFDFPIKIFLRDIILRSCLVMFISCLISFNTLNYMDEGLTRLISIASLSTISTIVFGWIFGLTYDEKKSIMTFFRSKL